MNIEITEALLGSLLQQIQASPGKHSVSSLKGDREQNLLGLLGLRELRSRGLIEGEFINDSSRARDSKGPLLDDAARLTPR